MRIVGTVKFPDNVLKYFENDTRRREIQLDDGSIVSREKFQYSGQTVDLTEMEEQGSIYKYLIGTGGSNRYMFMEDWFVNISKVDCLFQEQPFLNGRTFYTIKTGNKVYKLNYNVKQSAVMFTGLNVNNCMADKVPLKETQDYFNTLYKEGHSVKEHNDWSRVLSSVSNY